MDKDKKVEGYIQNLAYYKDVKNNIRWKVTSLNDIYNKRCSSSRCRKTCGSSHVCTGGSDSVNILRLTLV
ncbi:hypothetical protein HID58_016350, partial [Brassica napus]